METNELLLRVDTLQEEIVKRRPLDPEVLRAVTQKLRLEWNYHSNALEGNSIDIGETQIFLQYGLTAKGKPLKDHLDISGHNEAIGYMEDFIGRNEQLTEAGIRELHKVILKEPYQVRAKAKDGTDTTKMISIGAYKTTPNHVETPDGSMHYYASPEETPSLMGDLMNWLRGKSAASIHPVVRAAHFHHQFTAIHPFDDGNGRMARLLMNLLLMERGFPPAIVRLEDKTEYLYALRTADTGKLEPFVDFIAACLIRSQETYLSAARGEAIDELDDIDKDIQLLRQELHQFGDPQPLTDQVQEELYKKTLEPLLRRYVSKTELFDEFFAHRTNRVHGLTRTEDSTYIYDRTPDNEIDMLVDISGYFLREEGNAHEFQLIIDWQELRKSPFKRIDLQVDLRMMFQRLSYKLEVLNKTFGPYLYGTALSDPQMNEIVKYVCDTCGATIRKQMLKVSSE